MSKRIFNVVVLLIFLMSFLGTSPALHAAARSEPEAGSPADLINPDGTLNLSTGFSGSMDLSSYSVALDPQRGPILSPVNTPAVGDWENLGGGVPASPNAAVHAIAIIGSDVYIGGEFVDLNNDPAMDYIARWDGTNWNSLGGDGAGGSSINGCVDALAVSGTDLYAGGCFSNVNNGGTVLWNADRVAKWNGSKWFALGSNGAGDGAISNEVTSIAVGGTDVYIGGYFTNVNNNGTVLTAADYVAKWDGSNWSALGDNGAGNGSLNYSVWALAVSGSNVYVGGGFYNVNNGGTVLNAADYVAKWDGSNWSALGSNGSGGGSLNSSVLALAVSGTDVYVGGNFGDVNDNGTILYAADLIAKWDGSNWSALGNDGAGGGSLNSTVRSILVDGTDIYVGGDFTNVNNGGTVLSTADHLAKWDGSEWSAFGSNGAGEGSLNNSVNALGISGSDVYVGGFFTGVNDSGTPLGMDFVAHWDGIDWLAMPGSLQGAIRNSVKAIVVSGTDVYVGGYFVNLDNIPEADYIAKWDGSNWSALGSNGAGNGSIPNYVYSIAVSGSDVYVGGGFYNVNNGGTLLDSAKYIAKWDGANWSALGSNGSGGGSLNYIVYAIAVSGGDVYAAGYFTDVNNNGTVIPEADYIAKWDGANWSALGSNGAGNGSLNTAPLTIAVSGSNLYVGGAFTNVNDNGMVLPEADYIAKWDGNDWSALGSNGAGNGSLSSYVFGIAVSGADVYAVGSFINVNDNGASLPEADYVAKWDGSNWSALGNNGAGNGAIPDSLRTVAVYDGDVYVGGLFTNVDASGTIVNEADYIAKWNGANWSALGSNGAGNGAISEPTDGLAYVSALATGPGALYVGGNFWDVNNNGSVLPYADYLAAYGLPADVTPPVVQSITRAGTDPANTSSLDFNVAFSEAVTGVDASAFDVAASAGISGVILNSVSGSGSSYTVTVSTGSGDGTIGLNLVDDDSIVDTSGNPLGGTGAGNGDFTGEVYSVAKTAPVPLLPADGAVLNNRRPFFDWSDFAGAKGYQIQVSKSPKFGTYVLNASLSGPTNSQYTPTKDLPANTTLYWRVRGKLGSTKYTPWSSAFSFHTGNPPSVPGLSTPSNNQLLTNLSPTLDWANSTVPAGTSFDHYQLQLDDNSDFSSPAADVDLSGVTNSSYLAGPLNMNTKYYWHVRAWNTSGEYSGWSLTRTFREAMDAPVLVSPIGGITAPSLKPVFDWNGVAGATGYTIQVSLNSNFSTLVLNVTLKTSASTYTATTNLSHLKLYYWRVRANGPNGPTPWTVDTFMTP